MLKHLKYVASGLALMAVALSLLVIGAFCTYILSVVGSPVLWGTLILLIVAWAVGRLLDPAI